MFKKTLIAAAVVATTATFGANAATIGSATSDAYNVEYAASAKQVVSPVITVTTGRDFAAGDIIAITYTGATVATKKTDGKTAVVPVVAATSGSGAIEFLEFDGNTIKGLVTTPTSSTDTITFTGAELIITDAADKGKVTVSSVGKVDTVEGAKSVDASTTPATVATFSTQFAASVKTKFGAAKIDVNESRKKFVGGSLSDTMIVSTTNSAAATGSATPAATAPGVYVLNGDFTFLDADGDGKLGSKDGSITSDGGTVKVAEDFMSATVTASSFSTGTFGITVTNAADTVIPAQAFTIDADVSYTVGAVAGAKELLDAASAGSWVLNGAQVNVPFLPFGTQYSQSVTVSNTSSQAGGVDLVVYSGGSTVEFEGVATVGAKGVTDISQAVRDAVATIGNGNYSIDVIVNAPETAIEVTAVYYSKADGDRLRTK